MPDGEKAFEMKGITKKYLSTGVVANKSVDFEGEYGEIRGLVGENGSGKTTLMLLLSGFYQPDEGEIYIEGEKVNFNSPEDAIKSGIGMVHQERHLIPRHTVLENILLGHTRDRDRLDFKKVRREAREICDKYGFRLDLDERVENLSASQKQVAEIVKVLYHNAKIIILDEPTSVLTPEEINAFLKSVKKLADDGASVTLISHKLPIILNITDRTTVLRKGKVVNTVSTDETSFEDLANMMIGKEKVLDIDRKKGERGEEILKVDGLSAIDKKGQKALNKVSFNIHENEIFTIVGVSGNGQRELVEVLAGLRKATEGKIFYRGENIINTSVRDRMKIGIEYLPAERMEKGIIEGYDLTRNFAMNRYFDKNYSNKGITDWDKINRDCEESITKYDVKAGGAYTKAGHLSGGNIQKLLLARTLTRPSDLLIAEDPAQGLDVGSANFTRNQLIKFKEEGRGVLLVTGDLDEALEVSDRIAPIYEGELQDIIPIEEASKEGIGKLITGRSGLIE